MAPGAEGAPPELTVSIDAADVPQPLVAVTVTVPPAAPAVAEMLDVAEEPVHPPGNVQL